MEQSQSLQGETSITSEHVKNNQNMRDMLVKSGIYPEALPVEEDIKKVERRLKSEGKKLLKGTKKLKGK